MAENKKYYWLKLKDNFFKDKEIKKLRRIAGGDTYTIIYLKLQLLSLKNEGRLFFDNLEESFAEEMALELDEEVENVKVTINYLHMCGLIEEVNQNEFILPQTMECIGGETQGASRVRKFREGQKALQCNTEVTKCNTEIEIERRDKREEIEKNISVGKPQKNIPPNLDDVKTYCLERSNNVDANKWYDFYQSKGWYVGKNKMKDWKAAVRTWEGNKKSGNKVGEKDDRGRTSRSFGIDHTEIPTECETNTEEYRDLI